MGIVSLNLLLCEKVLREQDGVLSAIRIVDEFRVHPLPAGFPSDLPPAIYSIPFVVFLAAKFQTEGETETTIELALSRPDGEVVPLTEAKKSVLLRPATSRFPGAPIGVNLIFEMGVIPKMMGNHYISAIINSQVVARTPFTLIADAAD
jgi:hypothetical protein